MNLRFYVSNNNTVIPSKYSLEATKDYIRPVFSSYGHYESLTGASAHCPRRKEFYLVKANGVETQAKV